MTGHAEDAEGMDGPTAVVKLHEIDPSFRAMCEALFPGLEPRALADEVYSVDKALAPSNRKAVRRGLIAGTVAAPAAGATGYLVGSSLADARRSSKLGQALPKAVAAGRFIKAVSDIPSERLRAEASKASPDQADTHVPTTQWRNGRGATKNRGRRKIDNAVKSTRFVNKQDGGAIGPTAVSGVLGTSPARPRPRKRNPFSQNQVVGKKDRPTMMREAAKLPRFHNPDAGSAKAKERRLADMMRDRPAGSSGDEQTERTEHNPTGSAVNITVHVNKALVDRFYKSLAMGAPQPHATHNPPPSQGSAKERRMAAVGLGASGVAAVGGIHALVGTAREGVRGVKGAGSGGKVPLVKVPKAVGARAPGLARAVGRVKANPKTAALALAGGWGALHTGELAGDALALRAQKKALAANRASTGNVSTTPKVAKMDVLDEGLAQIVAAYQMGTISKADAMAYGEAFVKALRKRASNGAYRGYRNRAEGLSKAGLAGAQKKAWGTPNQGYGMSDRLNMKYGMAAIGGTAAGAAVGHRLAGPAGANIGGMMGGGAGITGLAAYRKGKLAMRAKQRPVGKVYSPTPGRSRDIALPQHAVAAQTNRSRPDPARQAHWDASTQPHDPFERLMGTTGHESGARQGKGSKQPQPTRRSPVRGGRHRAEAEMRRGTERSVTSKADPSRISGDRPILDRGTTARGAPTSVRTRKTKGRFKTPNGYISPPPVGGDSEPVNRGAGGRRNPIYDFGKQSSVGKADPKLIRVAPPPQRHGSTARGAPTRVATRRTRGDITPRNAYISPPPVGGRVEAHVGNPNAINGVTRRMPGTRAQDKGRTWDGANLRQRKVSPDRAKNKLNALRDVGQGDRDKMPKGGPFQHQGGPSNHPKQGGNEQIKKQGRSDPSKRKVLGGGRAPTTGDIKQRSSVGKVDVEATISKVDEDRQQCFGWASKVKVNGRSIVDKQNDMIDINDIEDAAYNYVTGSRVGGNMHKRGLDGNPHQVAEMIESMVFTPEKIEKLGLPDEFPQGWWIGLQVHDPDTWDEVRSGSKTKFSIHGSGVRKDVLIDD